MVVDVLLPNLFGEHGRPHYNYIIATFAHQLATNGRPIVVNDKELPLLHIEGKQQYPKKYLKVSVAAALRPTN